MGGIWVGVRWREGTATWWLWRMIELSIVLGSVVAGDNIGKKKMRTRGCYVLSLPLSLSLSTLLFIYFFLIFLFSSVNFYFFSPLLFFFFLVFSTQYIRTDKGSQAARILINTRFYGTWMLQRRSSLHIIPSYP
jgi:hypothetical protein